MVGVCKNNGGVINIQNKNQFSIIQKVAAIFFEQQKLKSYNEIVNYIKTAQVFIYSNSITFDTDDESDDIKEEIIKATPVSALIYKDNFNKHLKIFETPSPMERKTFKLIFDICTNYFVIKKKYTYTQTALLIGLTTSVVDKKRKN